jgi:hypothetical protein
VTVKLSWTKTSFELAAAIAMASLLFTGCSAVPADSANPVAPTADSETQSILDSHWERVLMVSPEAKRPDIAIIQFVDPEDYYTVIENCMHEAGWPDVAATADGGLESGGISGDQTSVYYLAIYTCYSQFPEKPSDAEPLTDARLGELYDYLANELQPCLEAEGYDTPAAPSRDKFVETYATTGGWNMYENVALEDQSEWDALNERCPQIPANFNG